MAPPAKKRSRYDLPEPEPAMDTPAANVPIAYAPPLNDAATSEAQAMLRAAFDEASRALQGEVMHVHQDFARRLDILASRLRDTRAEIDRLAIETERMRADRVHDLLRNARASLGGI